MEINLKIRFAFHVANISILMNYIIKLHILVYKITTMETKKNQ